MKKNLNNRMQKMLTAVAVIFMFSAVVTGCGSIAGNNATSTEEQLDLKNKSENDIGKKIEHNRKIAEGYLAAYDAKEVKDGATYADWKFAENADYWSPYFGDKTVNLSENPVSVEDSATFEALSYSVEFPDWGPVDFQCWPSEDGVAWKTEFGGHNKDTGEYMSFFAYSYIDTNADGKITHWETHVNSDYNDFLDVAIGTHGPFKNGSNEYMQAVYAKLQSAGIDLSNLKH